MKNKVLKVLGIGTALISGGILINKISTANKLQNSLATGDSVNVSKASQIINKASRKIQKHSPEILIGVGVVGVVASTVMACRATTKVNDIFEDANKHLSYVKIGMETGEIEGVPYSVEDGKRDKVIIYTQTAVKVARLYAPAVILGSLSLASIVTSNNILRKRNLALAAAYKTLDDTFNEYRGRVVERFGEEVDQELRYGYRNVEYTETVIDEETGEEKEVTKTAKIADKNLTSEYSRYFDKSTSRAAENRLENNDFFLSSQQNYFNNVLNVRGHVYLNEVYDALGLERSKAGQIVGWTKNGPDGYIDFRIREVDKEVEPGVFRPSYILDFNVQGNIWDDMKDNVK